MELILKNIESKIYTVRNKQVILDSDLAALYQVETKVLNQAVSRNVDRFPSSFRFQLTDEEVKHLRSQIVTSNVGRGGRRFLPRVFTEHGVVMAASILNSAIAIAASGCGLGCSTGPCRP